MASQIDINQLIEKVKKYNPDSNSELIRYAHDYASKAHKDQKRNSGEPYIIHPLNVALILADLNMDDATICAGLLHDVLEDTEVTEEQMIEDFGAEITRLVDGVTKLTNIPNKSKLENQVYNYRKMVMAMANDIRVIIVKLADRLHNLRTLEYMTRQKQILKANETLEIYVPIAHRLGMSNMKWELEDLCLKYIDPEAYYEIAELIDKKRSEREEYIKKITEDLAKSLDELNIKHRITGRPKSIYSVWSKMHKQKKTFSQIFDLTAIRVLVEHKSECYTVLGIVHSIWKPLSGRFKDYIAMPKSNMYQSIHTTVMGPKGETFEVQIRTYDMHKTSEYGIAAHWKYKEGKNKNTNFDEKLVWLRQLMEWQQETVDNKEFLDSLHEDWFNDEVFVFTPNGDVVNLPAGSTPIDFAYKVHSDVGNRCIGAKVNERIVPLSYELKNGNIVSILTSKNSQGPSRDWLNIVKSTQAKQKIKQFFKHSKKEENIVQGREMLEKDLRKDGYRTSDIMKDEWLLKIAERHGHTNINELFASLGYGSINLIQVTTKLKEYYREYKKANELNNLDENEQENIDTRANKVSESVVKIDGQNIGGLELKFAKCCSPVPGDSIIGFITMGRGISIHKKDCENIKNVKNKERLIHVEWNEPEKSKFYVQLEVLAMDKKGYLAILSETIALMGLNVVGINTKINKDRTYKISLNIEIESSNQLQSLMTKIRNIEGTLDLWRYKN